MHVKSRIGALHVGLFLEQCAVDETSTDYPEAVDHEFLQAVKKVQDKLDERYQITEWFEQMEGEPSVH